MNLSRLWAGVAMVCALACAPAHAQTGSAKTPTALATETNAFFSDNMAGGITPFNTRQTLLDIISSYASISISGNVWAGKQSYSFTPTFSGLEVNALFTTNGISVPTNANYSDIRMSQTGGGNNTFTIGAGGTVASIYTSPESLAGSDATSNLYGAVLHCQNDGPGTCKGIHAGAFGSGTSAGTIVAVNGQIQPVATTANATAFLSTLTTSGINGIAAGYQIESNGDQYSIGFGNATSALPIPNTYYQAWMATSSAANARAFRTLNNAGTEIQYIKKTGEVVSSTGVFGGTEANGISVTQSAISRTAAAGAMTISAGTNAGNSLSMNTAGQTRLNITDTTVSTGFHAVAGSAVTPTISACGGGSPAVTGGDNFGKITAGSGALASCVINFGATWGAAPACTISTTTAIASPTVLTSTTQLTIGATSLTGVVINYTCGSTS